MLPAAASRTGESGGSPGMGGRRLPGLRFARTIGAKRRFAAPPRSRGTMLTLTCILFAAAGCLYVLLAAFLGHASDFVDFGHAGHVADAAHADAGHGHGGDRYGVDG